MATYDPINPATLSNFLPVINDPTDSEDANKLAKVDLQTRQFIYYFLSSRFDSAESDVLKADAVVDATLASKVKGSTGNAGTERAVVQGTISTPDLRDDAVTVDKLADNAVATDKIVDANVTTAKLADAPNGVTTGKISDLAVTTGKLADNAVTAAKLSSSASTDTSRAVSTDHIKDLAVTAAKIAVGAVGADALSPGSSAQILVADGSGKFQKVTLSGAATISNTGVLTLATTGYASIRELAANTVSAGAASATTWNVRGVTTVWTKDWETLAMATLGAAGKIALVAGTYLIEVSCPAYKTDAHVCRINRFNSSDASVEIVYGTPEIAAAANSEQTRSIAYGKMTFASGDYFKVEHYTTSAEVGDGLGKAAGVGSTNEVYAIVKIHRIA